jgi:hypothetical protein
VAGHGGRRWTAIGATAVIVALLTPTLVREARREIDVFWLWFPLHVGAAPKFERQLWRSPAEMAARVRDLESLGHAEPGVNAMYAAWLFWVYSNQNALFARSPAARDPQSQERYRAEAQQYMSGFYRRALREAPDNPNFASYAQMIADPEWPDIFRRALSKWPTYHHSPYMAYHMVAQAQNTDERRYFVQVYENGVRDLLASSAGDRPGYQRMPHTGAGRFERRDGPDGVVLKVNPDDRILFDEITLAGAPKLRLALFVRAQEGQVQASAWTNLEKDASTCSQFTVSTLDSMHYRYIDCVGLARVRSVRIALRPITPAVITVRDYYPLFTIVRPDQRNDVP